ncbi:unnamed protein product [Paramecium sonneborni]|uniref:Uncharacterized protein n=1 Tax=Paramecium sonneborni TaxID=65129 RepID=A0A8S1QSN0_9CILI|nr:unnamed protein product [Paramecium sonneborni]
MKYFIVFLIMLIIVNCQAQSLELTIRQRYQKKQIVNLIAFTQNQYQIRLSQQDKYDFAEHQNKIQNGEMLENIEYQRIKVKKIVKKKRFILKPVPIPLNQKEIHGKKRKVYKNILKCKKIIQD